MLKRSYKKLVSLVSAAAMLTTLAAPAVMADVTSEEEIISASEMAELQSAVVILEDNFDSAEEKVLLALGDSDQDPYTDLESVDVYIGKSPRGGADDTNASIKSGVGVDGSKALVLSSGAKATGTYGPRIEFKIPDIEDNFMISMDVYPTDDQDMSFSNDTATAAAAGSAFGLTKDEWNKVDIYVTRKGRVININDTVTVLSDTEKTAPVIWGKATDNAGEMYIDNIRVNSLTTLPTPIPTPTPEPAYQPVVGDVFNFDDYPAGSLVELGTVDPPAFEGLNGFKFYVGSRGEAGDAGTRAAIVAGGMDGSQALVISHARYADANRGPRAELVEPEASEYIVSFYTKADETMDLVLASTTTSNSGVIMDVPQDWTKVDILMFGGQRLTLIGGKYVELAVSDELPVLWGTHAANTGSVYIDNYSISELAPQQVVDAIAQTLDITNADNTVSLNGDVYEFIQGFTVPSSACNESVSWDAFESTDDGATWVATSDLKVGKTNISINSVSSEKLYKIVGTVFKDELEGKKEFILKYVATENVVDTVVDRLDILSETYADSIEKVGESYVVRGDFVVPTSDWVTTIDWSSSNESLVKIGPKGSILVYPKEATTVTLTATVTYNGESKTKEFTLDLSNYYQSVYRMVEQELVSVALSPIGTNGKKVTTMSLDPSAKTTLSYDVELSTSSSVKGMAIEWKTSDADILSTAGVINVDNIDENDVTLTKTVSYTLNGVKVLEDSKDYEVNVQFVPEDREPVAEELAKAYALASDETLTEANVENSTYYSAAMEMLYDRYVTRFDANYEENFEDIPTSIDEDFDLPTKGFFGSKITWKSSITNIKINDAGEADVTRPTSDKKAKLVATFTSGASVNADAKEIDVTVEGKSSGKGSSGGSSGGGSSYGGGNTYVGSLGSAAATPAPTVITPVQDTPIKGEFTDLDQASWAAVAINYLADKGIVSGRTSTTFDPNANITRAEFAKIIVGAFEIPTGGASAGFADVADDAWYAPYVNACFAAGIITGYDSTTFGPNDLVTRQDMAVMVMRAANLKGIAVTPINAKIDFADADAIAAYAVDAVTILQQGGIINGMTADTFAPTENATRAQAAKILYSFCAE